MAPLGTGRPRYRTLPLTVVVLLPPQPAAARSKARTRNPGPGRIANTGGGWCFMGPLRGRRHQSDPRTMPSVGQMAAYQVVPEIDGETRRTLPSHRLTRHPPAVSP